MPDRDPDGASPKDADRAADREHVGGDLGGHDTEAASPTRARVGPSTANPRPRPDHPAADRRVVGKE